VPGTADRSDGQSIPWVLVHDRLQAAEAAEELRAGRGIRTTVAPLAYLQTGVIYCDDNLRRLQTFPDECIDLIYLDPPFFSNRNYEVIFGDEEEVRSFEDRWEGGVNVYIDWMMHRLQQLYRILKPTGSFYLHCDTNASHYLKVRLDQLFGYRRFRNEIAWKRFSAKNDPKRFGRSHDTILFYTKSPEFTWNVQYGPFEEDYIEENYRYVEEGTGRRYRLSDLTANKPGGETDFEWHGARPYKGRHWAYSRENMDRFLEEGRIVFRRTGMPVYKRYLDEMPGVPLQDIWTDIRLHAGSRERVGYPTQKPEALMERIIAASTDEDDVVLDAFCGCGTTIAVAQRMRRQWIGIDISPTAVGLMKRRVEKAGATDVKVEGLPVTLDDLHELRPFAFQNWVIHRIHGTPSPRKSGDMGIDGYSFMEGLPVQVKQSEKVGRGVIDAFVHAVSRAGKHKGFIVAFSFTRGAKEEVARVKAAQGIEIELVPVSTLVKGAPDRITPELEQIFPGLPRSFLDLPLPQPRPRSARPSIEELVRSDKAKPKPGESRARSGTASPAKTKPSGRRRTP
jgi:DNA modification methylase